MQVWVALEQERFFGLSGPCPKRLLAPSLIDFGENPGIRALYQAIRIPNVGQHLSKPSGTEIKLCNSVSRTKLPRKMFNSMKNATKDPINDPKRVRKAPLLLLQIFHQHFSKSVHRPKFANIVFTAIICRGGHTNQRLRKGVGRRGWQQTTPQTETTNSPEMCPLTGHGKRVQKRGLISGI